MEDYSNSAARGSFLYSGGTGPNKASPSSLFGRTSSHHHPINAFHLQSGESFFTQASPIVKTEANPSSHHFSLIRGGVTQTQTLHHHQQQQQQHQHQQESTNSSDTMKAKIIAHPQYSNLLQAYMDCQKVGAPAEVVNRLTEVHQEFEMRRRSSVNCRESPTDPELDQFMEAYCDMLAKYREELARPLQEAMEFMRRIESQLQSISNGPIRIFTGNLSIFFQKHQIITCVVIIPTIMHRIQLELLRVSASRVMNLF
ncbi:hypothetical protein GIB67_015289 [Kingdonia uniflora]|uniref:Uncharacterized protein n=1 Tax=Kingdonia uniflora TaxID=39325 RepID=A0A7J7MSY4_9MAGN|nr:hypothetical protein GIB67_015289 [Kingdonia uniflora]